MNIRFRAMDRVLLQARVMVIHRKRVRDKDMASVSLRLDFD